MADPEHQAEPAGEPLAAQVVEDLAAGLLVVGPELRIELANPRGARILGRPRASLLGAELRSLLPAVAALLEGGAASSREPERMAVRHRDPGGREVTIGFSISRVGPDAGNGGGEIHALLFQDITEVTRLEEERNRLLQLAAVGEVLPSLLHELKNPLAAAIATVELLLEEVPEGAVQQDLHSVLGLVRQMKLALDGLGPLSAVGSARRHAAVDHALAEAFRILEPQMRGRGIRTRLEVPAMPLLPLDTAGLRSVLFNLVNNSIRACKPGDEIALAARLADGGATLEFTVADEGSGMAPEVLRRCRELFFTTRSGGSGVGLALCQDVVDRAGGEMRIESEPGKGTRVTVRLPVRAQGDEAARPGLAARGEPAATG